MSWLKEPGPGCWLATVQTDGEENDDRPCAWLSLLSKLSLKPNLAFLSNFSLLTDFAFWSLGSDWTNTAITLWSHWSYRAHRSNRSFRSDRADDTLVTL